MATLDDLTVHAPTIAERLRERLEATGLVLLGTTRADGWPRVSPMEVTILDGRLWSGSMPSAVKALDLRRDPRCCIITPLADKDDLWGEVKAFCRAREVTGGPDWDRLRARWREAMDLDIGEPGRSHLFELLLEAVAWQRLEGEAWRTTSWREGGTVRERVRIGATGLSEELPA